MLRDSVLNVLDFGGALGSSYFQCRKFLVPIKRLRWNIVEQEKHVSCGKEYLEDDTLKFYPTIEECLKDGKPDVIILSGVLHFLEQPYDIIKKIIDLQFDYVVIDRQPLSSSTEERLCVYSVPPSIYQASYPCWFLSETRFLKTWLNGGYKLDAESEGSKPLVADGNAMPRKKYFFSGV